MSIPEIKPAINIVAETRYISKQSNAKANRFVFAYTISITNDSSINCQLMSRHWIIQDSNNKIEEVYGDGVVGKQPLIKPGETFQYSSGAVIETEIGTMTGRFFMVSDSREFEITIPQFTLSIPRVIH